MRAIVFAYHDIGCRGLRAVLDAGIQVSAVFTHADDPGERIFFGSVARLASEHGIPVYAPDDVNDAHWVQRIAALESDFIFSFYYRKLLAPAILAAATRRVQPPRFPAPALSGPRAAQLGARER